MNEQIEERDTSDVDLWIEVLLRPIAKARPRVIDAKDVEVMEESA
jgi:hypothetical protein